MLYSLRYRQGTPGVQVDLIEAANDAKAEELGKWYCGRHPGRRYISVKRAVIAIQSEMEADLPVPELDKPVAGATGDEPVSVKARR